MLEAEISGYGASGRNGGWVAGYVTGLEKYVASLPMEKRRECCQLLFKNVDDIGDVLQKESIDAHFHKAGVLYAAARYPEQVALQKGVLEQLYQAGHTEEDCYWLGAAELQEKVRLRNGLGAVYKRHCATINPARMVTGLAKCVENAGVRIYENTRVRSFTSGEVKSEKGTVKAPVIVPALEGYSSTVKGFGNHIIPVQSLIVATEPLSDALWQEIGLEGREAFCDGSRMVSYGQRTQDGRMVFGARGGYVYGGKPRSHFSLESDEFRVREELLYDLFPMLRGVKIDFGWGGSLGVPRNFAPHAIFNPATGIGTAGGYGGQGVGPSHLFGRTLADLILGRDTRRTQMPWVFKGISHRTALRTWEPEPCRWLTSKAIVKAFTHEENICLKNSGQSFSKSAASQLSCALSKLMR